ncbi:MAG: hypothetical protein Q8O89_00665 [Nanoarchaeota archaeon]|nr:hypothetical protein [Nanoarchaeota archaeon]
MMAYVRKKKIKGKAYYYIVEGIYEDNKTRPKQKVIKYLGNVENILKKFEFWDKHQ